VQSGAVAEAHPLRQIQTLPALGLLLSAGALAKEPHCAPLGEVELRQILLQLRVTVELDDSATHRALVEELEERLPCADFAPSRQLWAEFLVHEALRAFAAGGDWQTPLGAAIRAFPQVDREVGPSHPMATWQPPPAEPAVGAPELAPAGLLLYVDGEGALALPPATGIHLVQKSDGRWWAGRLVEGEAIEQDWLRAPIQAPVHTALWADLSAFAGASGQAQSATPAADFFADPRSTGGGAGLRLAGRTSFRSPFGVAAEASVPVAPVSTAGAAEGRLGIAVSSGPAWASVGGGLADAAATEGAQVHHFRLLYPDVAIGARLLDPWSLELEASGGAAAAVQTGEARLGLVAPSKSWRPRIGIRASGTQAQLAQEGTDVRVRSSGWAIGAEVGATWSTER
jgi:hypothetical protein